MGAAELRRAIMAVSLASALGGCAAGSDGYPLSNPEIADQSLADGVPYFVDLRWGMTRAQVAALYPSTVESGQLVSTINPYLFGNCGFAVTFSFDAEALVALSMRHESGDPAECDGRLQSDLRRRFGDHPKIDIGKVEWFGPITTIVYSREASSVRGNAAAQPFEVSFQRTGTVSSIP